MRRLTTLLLILLVLLLQGLPSRLLAQSAPVLSSVTQQAFVAPVVVASSGFSNPTNVILIANKIPGVSITVSGSFIGLTATVQGRKDNGSAFSGPLTLIAPDGSSTTTSLSAAGTWNIDTSGQQAIQLNITALATGNAVVSFGGVAVAQVGGTVVIGAVTQGSPGSSPWLTAISPTSSSAFGITPISSTALEASHVLKASAGNLYSLEVTSGATAGFVMVFDATSAPSDGSLSPLPKECVPLPSNSVVSISNSPGPPDVYSTGITAVFSSTGCTTKTTSATAFFKGSVQ